MKQRETQAERYPRGLSPALAALRKHFGKRPLFVPSATRYLPMRHRALGELLAGPHHPGLPTGCFIEVLGLQHAGKTTVTFAAIDAVINQPLGATHRVLTADGEEEIPAPRKVVYLAYETLDLDYLRGAVPEAVVAVQDPDSGRIVNAREANVYVHEPETLEHGAEVLLALIASGEFGLAIVDSVPAMLPEEERAKRMDEATMALLARQLGKLFRKSTHLLRRYGVTTILINQWRDKPGVSFGDPRVAPGGKALGYFESIRLDVSGPHRTPWFTHGKVANIKTSKNKITGIQKAVATYHLERGRGLSWEVELSEALERAGLLTVDNRGRVTLKNKPPATFPTRAAWLEKLRSCLALADKLWAAAEKRGAGPVVTAAAANAGRGWED